RAHEPSRRGRVGYARERELSGCLADPGSIPGASTLFARRRRAPIAWSSDLPGIRSADSTPVAIPGVSTVVGRGARPGARPPRSSSIGDVLGILGGLLPPPLWLRPTWGDLVCETR